MKIVPEETRDYCLIKVTGAYVGGEETDKLFAAIETVLNKTGKHLILDFAQTTYFSSIVIGKLVRANRDYLAKDLKMVLINLSQTIKEIFHITKVYNYVECKDTLIEAERALY